MTILDLRKLRCELADQLAAHSAAAAGDYRGPPSEFGHVYLPCVLTPIQMRPPRLPLRRWGRAVWRAMSGRQAPADLPRELLEEIDIISALGRPADQFIDLMGAGSSSAHTPGVGCRTRCWWSVTGRRV